MTQQSENSDGADLSEYADKRKEVEKLLIKGTDEKLQKNGTKVALSTIEKAYGKAKGLELPWPQITAYRLAHLLFRAPNADLERVRELFREAMRDSVLGPMPKIYELAVLCRMKSEKQEIEACFEGAISLIRHLAKDKRSESEMNDGCYRVLSKT